VLAAVLAVLLVAGLSVTAWAYLTGRFGFGPLSAKDEKAVTAIADGVEAPEWASSADRECAADELVQDHRSAELAKRGLVDAKGDGWTYSGKWHYDDASTYVEALLDCSGDWEQEVGDEWDLESTDCLEDIDDPTMADYIVAETLALSEGQDDADRGHEEAISALDECYVTDPPEPSAKARPGYRSVRFTFDDLGADAGRATLMIRDDGAWKPLDGNRHSVDTDSGGQRACVDARAEAAYPWGTTTEAETTVCGKSEPSRVWWVKAKSCSFTAGCTTWELRYEGFESFTTKTVRLLENGGDCNSESGTCTFRFYTDPSGRGRAVSWSVYPGYDERFEARIGKRTVPLPG
jgi:hypothetical protein